MCGGVLSRVYIIDTISSLLFHNVLSDPWIKNHLRIRQLWPGLKKLCKSGSKEYWGERLFCLFNDFKVSTRLCRWVFKLEITNSSYLVISGRFHDHLKHLKVVRHLKAWRYVFSVFFLEFSSSKIYFLPESSFSSFENPSCYFYCHFYEDATFWWCYARYLSEEAKI